MSVKALMHYAQLFHDGGFATFDGTPIELSNISVNLVLMAARHDEVTALRDVNWLHDQIPQSELIVFDDMDHGSFTVGKEMSYLNLCLSYLRQFKSASYAETYI